MKKLIISSFLLVFAAPLVRGQSISPSAINSTGSSSPINGYILEWSVAEMALVNTATGSNLVVTQGVLQPIEQPTNVRDLALAGKLSVYPNPAIKVLNLQYDLPAGGALLYSMEDVAGRKLLSGSIPIESGQHGASLDIASLPAAVYTLRIRYQSEHGTEETTSYKVSKLN